LFRTFSLAQSVSYLVQEYEEHLPSILFREEA
jgi:hypothetical protein